MSEYCTCKVTLVFKMKDGTEIKSERVIEDMKVRPNMLAFLEESDVAPILGPTKGGDELLQAIDSLYNGIYLDKHDSDTKSIGFNAEDISAISFDDVDSIVISEEQNGEFGDSQKTFIFDPETKECTSKEDYHLDFMDNYSGDNKKAEAILSMHYMGDTPPEEIAEILQIRLEEVISVIENADEDNWEEDWEE